MVGRLFKGALALLLLLAAALVINTWRQGSRQVPAQALPPLAQLDAAAAAESLATAVRARTVAGLQDPAAQAQAFEALHAHLRSRYPLVHQRLELEVVNGRTLVFRWPGSDAKAGPIALMAHQDVVPISPGTESLWQQPPFEGKVDGGFIWGRGTWDDKGNLIAQLEAVEALLKTGFKPRQTVYLIYGHDEETGGQQGAAVVARQFKDKGIRLEFVIDEGLVVTQGIVPGIQPPAALVGLAEKGSAWVRIGTQAAGGHASMPPVGGSSAVGVLSAAMARLDAHPMPATLKGAAAEMFDKLAPEMPLAQRVVLGNLWLTRPLVERMLSAQPGTNAMLRTTAALTMFHAGNKENVLPGKADAVVDFRLLPGDSVDDAVAHARRVIADERVTVQATPDVFPASRLSSSSSRAYKAIEQSARDVFAGALVAPGLMLGGTDGRHFDDVADDVYRFSPVRAGPDDLARLHGTNERLSVQNFTEMIRFYHRLLQLAAGDSSPEGKLP
jgi:carboxypeptidase PM20D1